MGDDNFKSNPNIVESYTPGLQLEDCPQRDPADVDVNVGDGDGDDDDDVYGDGPDRSMQQESQETSDEDEVSE
jgi:hypothetical protein